MAYPFPTGIAITGNGQLGDMVATKAKEMGLTVAMWAPGPGPGFENADEVFEGPFNDRALYAKYLAFLKRHNATSVTEFENVPSILYGALADDGARTSLSGHTLFVAQRRHKEKLLAEVCDVAVPENIFLPDLFRPKDIDPSRLNGKKLRLKSDSDGYDGHGQWTVSSFSEAVEKIVTRKQEARANGGSGPMNYLLEAFVDYSYECSVIVGRSPDGRMWAYPAIRNTHKDGILVRSEWYPGIIPPEIEHKARVYARRMAERLGGSGLFAFEFFVTHDGKVLFNEFAPRIHNSGHLTMEAATMSQSETLIRCAYGMEMPEGEVIQMTHGTVMYNLLGYDIEKIRTDSPLANVFWHDYRKKETRKGRKMGHQTVLLDPIGSYVHQ